MTSPGVHGICHDNTRRLRRDFAEEVRRAHLQAGADAAIGRQLRTLLLPGVKRKMYRRDELQALVDRADAMFPGGATQVEPM